jgi:hypothetical protein
MVQGQVFVTRTQVYINSLEPAQELNYRKNVLLDLEPKFEPWKFIFENMIRIYM